MQYGSLHQVLTDEEKRRTYDTHGEEGLKNMNSGGGDPFDPFSRFVFSGFLTKMAEGSRFELCT